MLYHVRPRLYFPFSGCTPQLKAYAISEFEIALNEGQLRTGRPYSNKRYYVGHLKGRRAVDGILIETGEVIEKFHSWALWEITAAIHVQHHVEYTLLDTTRDAASDCMYFWRGFDEKGWESRLPKNCELHGRPSDQEPKLEVKRSERNLQHVSDEFARGGLITKRWQTFAMPTIERDRLMDLDLSDRLPRISSALKASPRGKLVVMSGSALVR
jgi:hypothetical protein